MLTFKGRRRVGLLRGHGHNQFRDQWPYTSGNEGWQLGARLRLVPLDWRLTQHRGRARIVVIIVITLLALIAEIPGLIVAVLPLMAIWPVILPIILPVVLSRAAFLMWLAVHGGLPVRERWLLSSKIGLRRVHRRLVALER